MKAKSDTFHRFSRPSTRTPAPAPRQGRARTSSRGGLDHLASLRNVSSGSRTTRRCALRSATPARRVGSHSAYHANASSMSASADGRTNNAPRSATTRRRIAVLELSSNFTPSSTFGWVRVVDRSPVTLVTGLRFGSPALDQTLIPNSFSALRKAIFSLSLRGRSTARNQSVPCLMLSMKG